MRETWNGLRFYKDNRKLNETWDNNGGRMTRFYSILFTLRKDGKRYHIAHCE